MLDEKTQGLITCIYLIRIQDHAIYCNISCCRVPLKQWTYSQHLMGSSAWWSRPCNCFSMAKACAASWRQDAWVEAWWYSLPDIKYHLIIKIDQRGQHSGEDLVLGSRDYSGTCMFFIDGVQYIHQLDMWSVSENVVCAPTCFQKGNMTDMWTFSDDKEDCK